MVCDPVSFLRTFPTIALIMCSSVCHQQWDHLRISHSLILLGCLPSSHTLESSNHGFVLVSHIKFFKVKLDILLKSRLSSARGQ